MRLQVAVHLQFQKSIGDARLKLVGLRATALNYLCISREHLKEISRLEHCLQVTPDTRARHSSGRRMTASTTPVLTTPDVRIIVDSAAA